ncbi:MAG: GNAT family N-acetyltransferase [Burkholderiaceae bacterium]
MHNAAPAPLPRAWRNAVEPAALVNAFVACPPEGFSAGTTCQGVPWFEATLDLLTTVDAPLQRRARSLALYPWLRSWTRWRTLFVGVTVSEYLPLPYSLEPAALLQDLLEGELGQRSKAHRLLVVKDIPIDSPLLDASDNAQAHTLVDRLRHAGFTLLQGQALAWVPIDCPSEESYLASLSYARRKNIRRKLRSRALLDIRVLGTGDPWLGDAGVRAELYGLYHAVYQQSETQFDLLTPSFFDAVLQDEHNRGCLFVYREDARMVGWNLCFECGDTLVDKYIGLDYHRSRELNLYVVSWMANLEHARRRGLKRFVAGWTDPQIKAELGARFTFTLHAVYPRSRLVRGLLKMFSGLFEGDRHWHERHGRAAAGT